MSADAPSSNADAQVVPVRLQGHSYDVTIRPAILAEVARRLRPLTKANKVVVVYDENLPEAHRDQILASLRDDFEQAIECKVPAGEDHKTVATVDRLYGMILKHGIDRGTPVIALGSGVIGDTATAAASKGINLAQDAKALSDAEAFFSYFKSTFIPLVESVYREITADVQ